MRIAASLSVIALLMIAGTGTEGASSASAREPAARTCATPSQPGSRVLHRVFFAGEATQNWHQGARIQSDHQGGRWFSKLGLYVRDDEPVRLRIPRHAKARITGWTADRPTRRLTVTSNPSGCPGGWHVFPGGLLFRGHRCLRLRVKAGDRLRKVPFGLRLSC